VTLPLPSRETVCGLPVALSATERVPFRLPEALGVKATLIVQFFPGASVERQLLACPKFAVAAILAMRSVAVPELVSVMGSGWLAAPTTSTPKVKLVGEKVTLGDPLSDPPPHLESIATEMRHETTIIARTMDFITPSSRLRLVSFRAESLGIEARNYLVGPVIKPGM
jgi:hypothetical protein